MLILSREALKTEFPELIKFIHQKHEMGPEIEKELFIDNTPVVNLCHTRGYFAIFDKFYIQYTMDHIIQNVELRLIGLSLQEIIFYDDYISYETARVKAFSSVNPSEQTGLNMN